MYVRGSKDRVCSIFNLLRTSLSRAHPVTFLLDIAAGVRVDADMVCEHKMYHAVFVSGLTALVVAFPDAAGNCFSKKKPCKSSAQYLPGSTGSD